MKDELGRKITKKIVGLRVKTYSHLIDDSIENKKSKKHNKENLNLIIMKSVSKQQNL